MAGSASKTSASPQRGKKTNTPSGTKKIGGPSALKTLLRFLFFCCGLAALLGLDILLTGNHLRAFAVLFGAELILYVLFLSVKMLKQGGF